MSIPTNIKRQQGVALFLSLIMLLVLTVLGISSFQNSHIQERAAGNARLQSIAFEAAAAGSSSAINFWETYRDDEDLIPDELCGSLGHTGWHDPDDPDKPIPTPWVGGTDVGEATLKQRMYCLADKYDDESVGRPARSQLFVLSRGEVLSGGVVVAQRDVEVRLDIGATGVPGDGCGAFCFPSCNAGNFVFPNSDSFHVDGGGGYAITGGCTDMTNAINLAIRERRIGNYDGGVETAPPGSPWDSPANTEDFRLNVMASAEAAQDSGFCMGLCFHSGSYTDEGNTAYGTPGLPQITYIDGDASFGGSVSGAGILFVNGNLSWNGTPPYEGLIVVLGGTFSVDGGGQGGDYAGSVVVLNHPDNPYDDGAEFGPSAFQNNGGGTALYAYDCGVLLNAQSSLLDAEGQGMWNPQCNAAETLYDAGPTEMIIASWRENIGWREVLGSAEAAEEE